MVDERRERARRSHRTIAVVRDLVEVLAILAAGAWAIYTFIYEQRILPAKEPPSVLLTGSLQRLAERDGMVQMKITAKLRNTGHNRIYLIADSLAVSAVRYAPNPKPLVSHPSADVTEYARSTQVVRSAVIYRVQELTRYADPNSGRGYDIDPGEEIPYSGVFLVRKRDFDAMSLFGSVAYTKVDGVYPTKVTYMENGAVLFENTAHKPDYDRIEVTLDQATLW